MALPMPLFAVAMFPGEMSSYFFWILSAPFRIQFRLLGSTLKIPNLQECLAFTLSDKTTYPIKLCGVFTLCISVLKM